MIAILSMNSSTWLAPLTLNRPNCWRMRTTLPSVGIRSVRFSLQSAFALQPSSDLINLLLTRSERCRAGVHRIVAEGQIVGVWASPADHELCIALRVEIGRGSPRVAGCHL